MLSVIVPTIWKFEPHIRYLEQIVDHECIGEIIIVDNNKDNRPPSEIFKHPKIKLLEQTENIYVNPAWNLGVKNANYENVCFLSDDVIADPRCFYEANVFLDTNFSNHVGMIITMIGWEAHNQPKVSTGIIKIEKFFEMRNNGDPVGIHGAFALFFCHKSNYVDIPEDLKILSGDAFLWHEITKNGKVHYSMHNFFFYSPFGVSCSEAFKNDEVYNIALNDLKFWDEKYKHQYNT